MTTKVWMASSANLSIKLRTQVSIGIGLNLCAIRWCQGSFFKALAACCYIMVRAHFSSSGTKELNQWQLGSLTFGRKYIDRLEN